MILEANNLIKTITNLLALDNIELRDIKDLDLDHKDYLINEMIKHNDPNIKAQVQNYFTNLL